MWCKQGDPSFRGYAWPGTPHSRTRSPTIANVATKVRKKSSQNSRRVTVRSQTVRDAARALASLGHRRFRQGHPLNVRRREEVRRHLAEAGEELEWDVIAVLREDPLETVNDDVKKMLQSGVRALKQGVDDELAEKRREGARLDKMVARLEKLADDPEAFPLELEYEHTGRKTGEIFPTKTQTLTLDGPEDALKAVKKLEKSLPRWEKIRQEAIADLKQRRETLEAMRRDLSDVIEGWQSLLRDVVVTIG
jgi:Asp-tRNA(Asn)/Glu-tRNA(Gln) amidotransferase A subunit family amidase